MESSIISLLNFVNFSHLADTFIQATTNDYNRSNLNQQKSNNMQVLLQILVSLTQCT